jgi:chromosome segregation ATPase
VQVQAELEELAASGEGHEAAIDDLTRAVLERTSERDTISGRLKEQSTEIERLTAALAHQSRASETLRLEIAKLMVQTDGVEARAAEVLEQLATLRAESMTCTNELKIEKEARSAVERRAEVSESRLQNSQEALTNANDRLAPLHARVQEGEDFARRAVAAEATVSELRGLVGLLQTLLSSGRSPVSPACPSWDEESGRDPVDAALSGGASA